ncbi:MAG: substrate-binding domain-containing protein [Casimicrobiaceae bacterium]
MSRVVIKPAWVLSSDSGDHFEPQLFRLLKAIYETGKLTEAVQRVGISYRHGWNLLAKWSAIFGSDVVDMQRGRGATLTALGEKLLWAEQRTEASLFPQLENIASELNAAVRKSRRRTSPVLRLHASHGYAVEKLPELVRLYGDGDIDLRYVGSVEALAALSRAECDLAGFHVPLGELGPSLWQDYAKWVKPRQQRVIRLVIRTQGLIVAKGNPRSIKSLHDLTRKGIKFVNRQLGSGTRVLLDGLLRNAAVNHSRIQGYDSGEYTHAAVAAFVASGMADVGLGIEPAARQFNLDFLPIIEERYMLACSRSTLARPAVIRLIELMKGPEFAHMLNKVAGYRLDEPGEVVEFETVFPWLRRGSKKRATA